MAVEKEYKTSFSTMLKISTIQTLDEYGVKTGLSRSDIGRRIIEYFIEHHDIEELQA